MSSLLHLRFTETLKYHDKKGRLLLQEIQSGTILRLRKEVPRIETFYIALNPLNFFLQCTYTISRTVILIATTEEIAICQTRLMKSNSAWFTNTRRGLREEYNIWHSGRKSSATVHGTSIRCQGIAAAGLILIVSMENIIKTSVLDTGLCPSCFLVMNVP